jgi:hypothetical protein
MLYGLLYWMMYGRHDAIHDAIHDTAHDGVNVIDVLCYFYYFIVIMFGYVILMLYVCIMIK